MEISPLITEKINILFRILKIAEHGAVIIAVCNNIFLRGKLIANLENKCNDLRISFIEVKLDEKNRNLIGTLEKFETDSKLPDSKKRVYSATGIEEAIPEALTQLNLKRDYFYDFRYPLILWVKSETVRKIMTIAPDFWHIRAKKIEFIPRDEEVMLNLDELITLDQFTGNREDLLQEIRIHEKLLKSLDESNDRELTYTLNSLLKLGVAYGKLGNLQKSSQYTERGLKLAKLKKRKKYLAGFINNCANVNYLQGNYKEATKLYNQALEIANAAEDDRGVATVLHQLGMVNRDLGNLEDAIGLYEQALGIEKKLEDKRGISSTLSEIGIIHKEQGNYKEAMKLYDQALKIDEEIGNKKGIASTLKNLGNIYYLEGNCEEANELYKQALNITNELGDKKGTATAIINMGIILESNGDYASALNKYQEASQVLQSLQTYNLNFIDEKIKKLKEKDCKKI